MIDELALESTFFTMLYGLSRSSTSSSRQPWKIGVISSIFAGEEMKDQGDYKFAQSHLNSK